MMPSINSEVAIGRRMKGCETFMRPRLSRWSWGSWGYRAGAASAARARRRGLGRDLASLIEPVLAVDDDLLAGAQPLGDGGDAVLALRPLDVADLDGHVRLDDEEVLAVGPPRPR